MIHRSYLWAVVLTWLSACSASEEADAPPRRFPCEVERALAKNCSPCHADPPQQGAPFPLVRHSNAHRIMDGQPLYAFMERAIVEGRMPLEPIVLNEADKATLLAWLRMGAPPAQPGQACAP